MFECPCVVVSAYHEPGKASIERPGFNPQALARSPGCQRSGASKDKKAEQGASPHTDGTGDAGRCVFKMWNGADHGGFLN
jgi:hypothetical protein